ncbi:MAG: LacI family DNA-binding transcriptional regulator [Planctomycetota bacterium]
MSESVLMSRREMYQTQDVPSSHRVYRLFEEPFPRRGAVDVLRDRVVNFIQEHRPAPGTPFLTDADLAVRSGLSRSTIRRALEPLQQQGWISREAGRGTFVGPRSVSIPDTTTPTASAQRSIRLGVLLFNIGRLTNDWITPQVMAGIDEAADSAGVRVELLGVREVDADLFSRRLERSQPDVLASLASQPRDALMLREAVRLGIKTMVVGTAHQFLCLPSVVEDNRQGMQLAIDALRDAGHERIGMVINRWPGGWVFERQEAFEQRLVLDKLDPHIPGTCWIGSSDHPAHEAHKPHDGQNAKPHQDPMAGSIDQLTAWLEKTQPTAVVAGSFSAMLHIGIAARRLGWSIPRDLSVTAMDQHPLAAQWLGVQPTLAALPLQEIGEQVARTARALADGAVIEEPVRVPFTTQAGQSVAPPRGS